MKSATRTMILLFTLVCAFKPAVAQTPEAAQLLRDVQAKYDSIQSYSATGDVVTVRRPGNSPKSLFPVSPVRRSTFSIKLARPQMYNIAWKQKGFLPTRGAVWSDGKSQFVRAAGRLQHPTDTRSAIAMATGISSGSAHTIPSIFFDLPSNGIRRISDVAVLAGEESVDGDNCYVVKAKMDIADFTFWISKASKLIRRQSITARGGVIQNFYFLETHHDIKINELLSPADFRERPGGE